MSVNLKQFEVWFVTGSQHLYGPETLKKVAEHSHEISQALNTAPAIPVKIVFKPVLVTPDAVTELCQAANNAPRCIGLITWCHTFSPSKMWINGLKQCASRLLHLHTQHNRDIPMGHD
jgi:L-arabinose isomerase